MQINGNEITFEHLSNPSRSTVGEKSQIRAKTPSFVSPNAKGDVRSVSDFKGAETLGKSAAKIMKDLFAHQ